MTGTIVDSIVATVGRSVITDSMVRRSIRVEALLAKEPLVETPEVWERHRDRLIEQALIKDEIKISRYPVAQADEIRAALAQVETQLGGPAAFSAKLREYRLEEADLAEVLGWQITFARFLSYRFRPAVQVTDELLREFYAQWKPAGQKPPFEAAREAVEAEFISEQSNRLLDRWINDKRTATRIETIQPKGARP